MVVLDDRFKKMITGIKDIHGQDVREGSIIKVEHVNYMGTDREVIDEQFEADVVYDTFNAMFRYFPSNIKEDDEHPGFIFNHRSSRFKLISI